MSGLLSALLWVLLMSSKSASPKPEMATDLVVTLDRTVTEREIEWRLEESVSAADHLIRVWKTGDSTSGDPERSAAENRRVKVRVTVERSPEDAKRELRNRIQMSSVGMTEEEPSDLGDKVFVSPGSGTGGASAIGLRRGDLVIWVSGAPLNVTRRFAGHLVDGVEIYERTRPRK